MYFRVENLSHEVTQLQSSLMLREAAWTGREQSYRRTITDLEVKVSYGLSSLAILTLESTVEYMKLTLFANALVEIGSAPGE